MTQLRFYRQVRYDGGMRSGIGIDEQPVLHEFCAGSDESDPALLWYVDIDLEGSRLPSDPAEGRAWLLAHADAIRSGLRLAAQRLAIGLDDTGSWPYRMVL